MWTYQSADVFELLNHLDYYWISNCNCFVKLCIPKLYIHYKQELEPADVQPHAVLVVGGNHVMSVIAQGGRSINT
jgi:hypothetical protein